MLLLLPGILLPLSLKHHFFRIFDLTSLSQLYLSLHALLAHIYHRFNFILHNSMLLIY